MKKFISALSSLVLAATAMGGALAFSADAATNGKVDDTIISFRSNGKNEVTVEKGGTTVPVSIYIPQSSGFHSLALKMAINGDETLGKGTVKDQGGKEYANYKYAFSNYGITAKNSSWADKKTKICLDSGAYGYEEAEGDTSGAGYYNNGQVCTFTPDAFNISYQAAHAINFQAADENPRGNGPHNIDSYDAWVAAGKPDDLTDYTTVETWTKDEKWAYDTAFLSFDLDLPADLPAGTYTLDVYTKQFYNCAPASLFEKQTDGSYKEIDDSKKTSAKSKVSGVEGGKTVEKTFKTEPLVITVGTPSDTKPSTSETTATSDTKPSSSSESKTTASSTEGSKVDIKNTIIYNLVPADKDCTKVADDMTGNNTMTAEPGEELKINWTVKNDQGTAGLQMTFDFSGVTYSKAKKGSAYSGTPQFNAKEAATTGEINYAMADKDGQTAEDDAVIYTFTIKAPESGSATIGPKTGDNVNNKVVPTEDGKKHEFLFHGLTINVDKPTSSETTASSDTKPTSSETTASSDTKPTSSETTASSDTKPTSSETTASSSDSKSETKTGTVLPGDVNCNGQVQINDVVLLNRYLAKTAEVSEQGLKNAECDGDGKIGQGDSSAIKEYLAKLIDVLPKK